jgi:TPR repeat protein
MAAAAAVLFALFSSDAMRDFVNVKASMASVASIFPAPSEAAPSNASLAPAAPSKDPARLGSPANRAPGAPVIARANVAPTREDMRNAYQSALQGQAPAAAATLAEPQAQAQVQVQIQAPLSPPHRIDPDEVAAALNRAATLIASRDIAPARLVLQRLADDGDAQAAVMLAETYDPGILERLGVYGMAPDITMAQHWYETAAKLGSTEAGQRLAVLATTNR